MKRGKRINNKGFTLIELITTIAIIGVLLALLIPALSSVYETAMKVKEKAQLHGLSVALETFSGDTGDYPPSKYSFDSAGPGLTYSGSHKLAEALIGRDGLGYHPESTFSVAPYNSSGVPLYYPEMNSLTAAQKQTNLNARKGPYLELESANAIKVEDIYGAGNYGTMINAYVLVDMFKQVRHQTTGKQIGMPILYYKANTKVSGHDAGASDLSTNTYNIEDAWCNGAGFPNLGVPFTSATGVHPMKTGAAWFYETIKNPNFPGDTSTGTPPRPYRSESFILHSAGPDGLYGTIDDIFNFDQDE